MTGDDEHFMRNPDALAWNMEHDPGLRSTIVGVAWLASPPDFEVVTRRLERATRLAPRFRQRPVPSPAGLSTPQWVDCEFDLTLHLRRFTAPEPRTDQTVLDFARSEAMTSFDVSRPLWQVTLVEGLTGDQARQRVDPVGGLARFRGARVGQTVRLRRRRFSRTIAQETRIHK